MWKKKDVWVSFFKYMGEKNKRISPSCRGLHCWRSMWTLYCPADGASSREKLKCPGNGIYSTEEGVTGPLATQDKEQETAPET